MSPRQPRDPQPAPGPLPECGGAAAGVSQGWHRWEQWQGCAAVCPHASVYLLGILESYSRAVVLSAWVFAMCFGRIVRYFLLEFHRNFL